MTVFVQYLLINAHGFVLSTYGSHICPHIFVHMNLYALMHSKCIAYSVYIEFNSGKTGRLHDSQNVKRVTTGQKVQILRTLKYLDELHNTQTDITCKKPCNPQMKQILNKSSSKGQVNIYKGITISKCAHQSFLEELIMS